MSCHLMTDDTGKLHGSDLSNKLTEFNTNNKIHEKQKALAKNCKLMNSSFSAQNVKITMPVSRYKSPK